MALSKRKLFYAGYSAKLTAVAKLLRKYRAQESCGA